MRKFHVVAKVDGYANKVHKYVIAQTREQAYFAAVNTFTCSFVITQIFAEGFVNAQF